MDEKLSKVPRNYFTFDFKDEGKGLVGEVPCRVWSVRLPFKSSGPIIGIDPGRNFGYTVIDGDKAVVTYGKLPKQEPQWKYGLRAVDYIQRQIYKTLPVLAIIEGPIFRASGNQKLFGEANLAHIRFGFTSTLYLKGIPVSLVPPAASRKSVMGDGKVKAGDVWATIDANAAESLLLAMYGLKKKGELK